MLNDFAVGPPVFDFRNSAFDAEAPRRFDADQVGGVDGGLALEPPHVLHGLGNRATGNCEEHRISIPSVAAVATDPCHLMTGLLPAVGEATADIALSDYGDPHRVSLVACAINAIAASVRLGQGGRCSGAARIRAKQQRHVGSVPLPLDAVAEAGWA